MKFDDISSNADVLVFIDLNTEDEKLKAYIVEQFQAISTEAEELAKASPDKTLEVKYLPASFGPSGGLGMHGYSFMFRIGDYSKGLLVVITDQKIVNVAYLDGKSIKMFIPLK